MPQQPVPQHPVPRGRVALRGRGRASRRSGADGSRPDRPRPTRQPADQGSSGSTSPAPAAPAAPASPPAAPYLTARLADLPQTVHAVMQVAVSGSASSARIVLSPPELGQVNIQLHYSADGVSASLVADHPDAAQALGQSTGELRRALEAQGFTVTTIDVSHTGADGQPGARRDPAPTPTPAAARLSFADDPEPDEHTIVTSRLRLHSSAVDVLA